MYRLVARGTIEELKYLRQIYKTQLTDQTIGSTDGQASELPKKKEFRGVAGDRDNKGELFGAANLLKYRDGTFMNYQSSSMSSKNADSAIDQVVFDDLLATVRGVSEDDIDGDDQMAAMDALMKQRGAGAPKRDLDDDDESAYYEDYGAESQVNMDILDRAEVAFEMPIADQGPLSRSAADQKSSPRDGGEPCPAPDRVASTIRDSPKRPVSANKQAPSNAEAPPAKDYSNFYIPLPTKSKKSKKRKVV